MDKWQDQKFGMLIHFGLYSQLGIVESWSICSEDWISRDSTISYDACKRNYWNTINKFKPEKLDPESWARYGKLAGMKYVVFTTKHHDGFNMFDTRYTDFSITKGPFKDHPRRNVAKEVFLRKHMRFMSDFLQIRAIFISDFLRNHCICIKSMMEKRYFARDIDRYLSDWRMSRIHKPLLLRGAR